LRFADELHRIAKGLDGFGSVIRNFNSELFFERHDQFNCVKAVCAKVINERRVFYNFVFLNTKVLDNNFLNAICDVAHIFFLTVSSALLAVLALARAEIDLALTGVGLRRGETQKTVRAFMGLVQILRRYSTWRPDRKRFQHKDVMAIFVGKSAVSAFAKPWFPVQNQSIAIPPLT
jgi:hypothetical protein